MCAATVAALRKGGNVTLSALADELGSVSVMLEWAVENGRQLDADVSAVLVGDDGKVRSNDDLVFYNQVSGADGAVRLRGKVSFVAERFTAFADIIDVDVDDLADSIEKVVLAASLDAAPSGTFGELAFLRLRMLRSSDSTELLRFDIPDASTERAFVFGEIYRRAGQWKFRAVGQGYDGGLAALVTDYGVEVDDPHVAPDTVQPTELVDAGPSFATVLERNRTMPSHPSAASPSRTPSPGSEVPGTRTGLGLGVDQSTEKIDTRKWGKARGAASSREPTMVTDTDPSRKWQPARLFPVAGIGGAQEQERRATSALLAVLGTVDELGQLFRRRMNAPATGRLATFTEVPFTLEGSAYRPDGVVRIERPGRSWTGLVEVKTGRNNLDERQLAAYLKIARAEGFDGLLTISNQITPAGDNHPVDPGQTVVGNLGLHHFSWAEIRYYCQLMSKQNGIADATQAYVLRELLRYLEHPRSGAQIFDDMGPHWVRVRDSVVSGILRPNDKELPAVVERFDQLTRYLCLHVGGLLGAEVVPHPRSGTDGTRRRQHLAEELCRWGTLSASLALPFGGGPVSVRTDLRAGKITCVVNVVPPVREEPTAAVSWVLRRLDNAVGSLRVEAFQGSAADSDATSGRVELLSTVRKRPDSLVVDPQQEIRRFEVSAVSPLGSKRGKGKGTFITSVVTAVEKFHKAVVTHIVAAPSSTTTSALDDDAPVRGRQAHADPVVV